MSWKAAAYVKSLTENITAPQKLLLFVLSDYYNDHQEAAWPSIDLLAKEALLSRRQCQRLLNDLETKGYIRRVRRDQKTNLYAFPALEGGGCQIVTPLSDRAMSPGGVIAVSPGGCHSSVTRTVNEPIEEQKPSDAVASASGEPFHLNAEIEPVSDKKKQAKAAKPAAEFARGEVDSLYRFFYEQLGMDGGKFKMTVAHRTLAYQRLRECYDLAKSENGNGSHPVEELVGMAADIFEGAVTRYIKTPIYKQKTWGHLCSADCFRAQLAPKKERAV